MRQRRHHILPQGDNWLEAFTTSLRHADLRPRTVAGYRDDLTQFWRWFQHTHGPRASLQTLHASDLVHYRHQLLHVEQLQPATINRRLQALRKQNPGKLVELATLLGHDSLDTTALYTRPSTEDLAADLERSPLNVYG
jgi:site-specific recombinase XerD